MRRKFLYIYSLSVLGLLSLQSCFVAKDYKQPDIVQETVDEDLYRTDNLATDSLSMADLSWKDIFKDPILQDYIDEGLNNNLDIRIALQQINAAESYLKQGKAGYFPTIGAQAEGMHQKFSKNTTTGAMQSSMDQFELSAGLSWEADIWGKIRSGKRAAEAGYLQSVAAHQAVKSKLVSAIASTYYQLITLDEQIAATERTLETRRNSLETTKALKDAGRITEVAVKQTEAQVYNAEGLLVDLKSNAKLLENTLSILLGSGPREIVRGTMDAEAIDSPLQLGVPSQLLSNRPDLRAAEFGLIAAFENTNITRSQFYPSLTINANGGLQSMEIKDLFNANSLFAGVIGGLTQPILQGRRIRTQHEVAKADQESAKLNFMYTFLNASKEVSDAMYRINAAEEKIIIKEKEYDALAKAVEYSQELLNYGLADYLEVLRAEENALFTNISLIESQNEKLQSTIELYRALGGGWN
ncbi:MAG TPA: TolC family protein [Flavobacteriaceae bacterium]|nr:TolC family protein [Flavobacteriaceae bacterium]